MADIEKLKDSIYKVKVMTGKVKATTTSTTTEPTTTTTTTTVAPFVEEPENH